MEKDTSYNPATRWSEKHSAEAENTLEHTVFYTMLRQTTGTVEQITFRLKNGNEHTLPANEITEMFFNPSQGITLFFSFGLVLIQGRNLEKLHQHLKEKRVKEIREFSEQSAKFFETDALVISGIQYDSENLKRMGLR